MTLSHLYQNFGDQKPPQQTPTTESRDAVEDEKLQSFEDGYKAGWEDAVNAQSQARDHIDNEFAKNLQEISFSFHEARTALKKELGEMLEPVFLKLLPIISHETFIPKIIENISRQAGRVDNAGPTGPTKVTRFSISANDGRSVWSTRDTPYDTAPTPNPTSTMVICRKPTLSS